jgi:hypothetical protein
VLDEEAGEVLKVSTETGSPEQALQGCMVEFGAASQPDESIYLVGSGGEITCLRSTNAPRLRPEQVVDVLRNDRRAKIAAEVEAERKAGIVKTPPEPPKRSKLPEWLFEEDWLTSKSTAQPVGGRGLAGAREEPVKQTAKPAAKKAEESDEEGAAEEAEAEEEPADEGAAEEATDDEGQEADEGESDEEESATTEPADEDDESATTEPADEDEDEGDAEAEEGDDETKVRTRRDRKRVGKIRKGKRKRRNRPASNRRPRRLPRERNLLG